MSIFVVVFPFCQTMVIMRALLSVSEPSMCQMLHEESFEQNQTAKRKASITGRISLLVEFSLLELKMMKKRRNVDFRKGRTEQRHIQKQDVKVKRHGRQRSRGVENQNIVKTEEMEKAKTRNEQKKRKSQNTTKKYYGIIFASVPTLSFLQFLNKA